MTEPVLDAAQALTPFLASGVDGVIAEVTRQAGAGAAALVRKAVARLRDSLSGEEEVARVLRDSVADGYFSEGELTDLVRLLQPLQVNSGVQVKGNAYINNTISIDGGGSFHG